MRMVLLVTLALILFLPASSSAGLLWALDVSMGYLFVSEAKGTPWFSNTEFPLGALSVGGEAWAVGVSVDYAENSRGYVGQIPGPDSVEEQIEEKLTNTSFRFFARVFPGGRQRAVAPYVGLGVGPAVTALAYTGETSGREEEDSVVRVGYAVSVGSKVRLWESPFRAFFEGSFGGLGALPTVEETDSVTAPRKALNLVCVAVGLGVTF
ncbi:MAG: hypothetical protein JSW03_10300 [Candidatus Eiseniibacteriota bacterium]|nr:MAG: hypothetical protein JSW03_10300 [Candidatus Eisenbacteria bacterium]